MGVGPEPGGGGGHVRDHVDPDGRAAEAGLHDVGARETRDRSVPGPRSRRSRARGARRRPPRRRRPACPSRGRRPPPPAPCSGCRPGRTRPAATVLTRAPVAAVDGDVENHRPGPAPPAAGLGEAPVGPDRQPDGLGPAGHAVEEVGRLQGGRNPEPVPGLRPVEADHVAVRPDQGPGHLETGQDADVVLGGRAPEDDGDGGEAVGAGRSGAQG